MAVKERILRFGEGGRLVGLLSLPDESDPPALAALLFNAGIVHRVGAHRFNVKLGRALARAGIPALRFDLSGLGDSGGAPPGLGFEAQAVADIIAGADGAGEILGAARLAAIGMCSGADNGWRAALADERIGALVLLDPWAYDTPRARIERLAAKAADRERWARAFGRLVRPSVAANPADEGAGDRGAPPREAFGEGLAKLAARGTDILILYTKYVEGVLTRPEHFHDSFRDFDFRGRLDVSVNRDVDHTYTEVAAQEAVIERISNWLLARIGGQVA